MGKSRQDLSDHGPFSLLELDSGQARAIGELVTEVWTDGPCGPEEELIRIATMASRLPAPLAQSIQRFRLTGRPYGGFVLRGLPVDQAALGPTPADYRSGDQTVGARRADTLLLLLGSLLGNPFSYATQQRGQLVLDVFPVRGHEDQQLGSSSAVPLEWHNEDAFHPDRADWIMLFCLRNPYAAATTVATVQDLPISEESLDVLFEERFIIRPDESHTASFNASTTGIPDDESTESAFEKVLEMTEKPKRISILGGRRTAPFVRIDPAFMEREFGDVVAEKVLSELITAVGNRLADVILRPGDLLILDNKRAVHGRRPFEPRYDGTDRWLKRVNLTADLRKTEGRRTGEHGRALT